jgi:hypothetical protein
MLDILVKHKDFLYHNEKFKLTVQNQLYEWYNSGIMYECNFYHFMLFGKHINQSTINNKQ